MRSEYLWFELTGWVGMLKPYILPFWIILTYVYTFLLVKVIMTICKIPKETYSLYFVVSYIALISFLMFMLESIFTHVFATLMRFNDPRYGFITSRDGYGLSIYDNAIFFIFTLISVCFCVYLCYKLNIKFTMPELERVNEQKTLAILFISILTSPLIFFVPLREAFNTLFPLKW